MNNLDFLHFWLSRNAQRCQESRNYLVMWFIYISNIWLDQLQWDVKKNNNFLNNLATMWNQRNLKINRKEAGKNMYCNKYVLFYLYFYKLKQIFGDKIRNKINNSTHWLDVCWLTREPRTFFLNMSSFRKCAACQCAPLSPSAFWRLR